MKVLSIGSDRKLFEEGSSVSARSVLYGKKIEALHIVVFALASSGLSEKKLSDTVTVYPTNSTSRWFFVWDALRLGTRIVREKGFVRGLSVVTAQDPFESGFVAWRVAGHFRLPFQLQVHTDFLSAYFQTSLLQKLRVWTARFILPRADGVRVVSSRIASSLQHAGVVLRRPVDVSPIRIDITGMSEQQSDVDLKKLFPQFKFIILMASRLTSEKRIDDALVALKNVLQYYAFAGLVIAGEGTEQKKLEQKARDLGIENHVVFLGFRTDVFSFMKSAHMFLSTSEYEGYGMSLVEAGLAQCPILTTNVGITHDILVHKVNSYVCPVGDTGCMSEGILDMLGNNNVRYTRAESLFQTLSTQMPTQEQYVDEYVHNLEKLLPQIPHQ